MSVLSKVYNSFVGPYRGLPFNEKIRLFIISVAGYSIVGLSIFAVLYILST
jgi:hypothetical protein